VHANDDGSLNPRQVAAIQRAKAQQQLAHYDEVRTTMEAIRVTAESTDRTVQVQMAVGGVITDLKVTATGMAKTPETLTATIMEAYRAALREIAVRVSDEVSPLTGRKVEVGAVAAGRLPDRHAVPVRGGGRFATDDE
jgi:DNA-binding protein YbaB